MVIHSHSIGGSAQAAARVVLCRASSLHRRASRCRRPAASAWVLRVRWLMRDASCCACDGVLVLAWVWWERRLQHELAEKKKRMAEIIEVANVAYEQRDRAQTEIGQLKLQAEKEQQEFESEWKEVRRHHCHPPPSLWR